MSGQPLQMPDGGQRLTAPNLFAFLLFEVDGKLDHAAVHFVEYIAVFEVCIPAVEVGEAVAEFYFGANGYEGQKEIEADAKFGTEVRFFEFDEVFGIAAAAVAGKVVIEFYAGKHVHFEVLYAVAVELDAKWKSGNVALNDFFFDFIFESLPAAKLVSKRPVDTEDEAWVCP